MARINPRVDLAFKKIFGVEENKDLLISLINAIVSKNDQVQDLTILNPYNAQKFKHDKLSILDIKARGVNGQLFNIEIQIADEADYDKRALYYWAKLYSNQLRKGDDYSDLAKAIGIHILNFTSILESKKYHNVFHVTEKETGALYFKDLELHTIELKKFCPNANEELNEFVKRVKNALDIWLAFLTRHDLLNKDHLPEALEDASLKKAIEVLDVMNMNEEERHSYEEREEAIRLMGSFSKRSEEKGFDKGKAEGEKLGLEKGREEGEKLGAQKQALATAKAMKAKNMDIALIAEITGLELKAIEKI